MDNVDVTPPQSAIDTNLTTYTPSYEDLLAANRLVYRPTVRRVALFGMIMGLGLANVAIGLLLPAGERGTQIGLGVAFFLAPAVWRTAFSLLLLPHYARRYYRQAAILRQPFVVSWSEAGLDSRTPRSTSLMPWEAYIGRREDASTMLFYQTDAVFQFLPKHALTAAQIDRLRELAAGVPERPCASFRSPTRGS